MLTNIKLSPRRKLSIVLYIVFVLAVLCSAGIIARFVDVDKAINSMSIGYNDIKIDEKFDPPEELYPGVSFQKDIQVTNTGPVSCFVRAMVVYSDSDMGKYCTADWNEKDWAYNSADNYWYYKTAIKTGENTTSLITNIKLDDSIDPAVIKDFDVIVYAESYQSYGFSDYADAWEEYQKNRP